MVRALDVDGTIALKEQLREAGYAVIPAVVPGDLLGGVNDALVDAYRRSDKFRGGGTIIGHVNCFPGETSRPVFEHLEDSGIVDAIHELRPGLSSAVTARVNFNLPGSAAQHYHMDGVFAEAFIVCNIAVVDTDARNGAIDVLPGTHRQFYPFWRYALERKYRLTTRVPLARGDVLVRWSTLWHRGMPNKSGTPRPMMSFTFGERGAPTGDPFAGDPYFYPNWYSNGSRLSVLRERLEAAAPVTRSAVRFVRSIGGDRGYSAY